MFHRPTPSSSTTQPENAPMTTTPETTATDSSDTTRSVDIPTSGNPFQRTGQAQAATAASRPAVPSAYATPNYPSYGSPASGGMSSSVTAAGRRLVIGEGITMSGEIESCDHLVVEGTVEAALKGANILEIAEKGMFYGTVEISEATIAGKFEGELTVNGRLTIRGTGSVTGAITYKELAVEAGAVIDGKINPVGGSKGVSSEKKSRNGKASANTNRRTSNASTRSRLINPHIIQKAPRLIAVRLFIFLDRIDRSFL